MPEYGVIDRMPGVRALYDAADGGEPSVTVAVLDSDIDLQHPCFRGADIGCLSMESDAPFRAPSPGAVQGTHVASLICGQPGSPIEGLAPRCRVIGLPMYAERASGEPVACHKPMLGRAIRRAAEAGADIITISGAPIARTEPVDRFFDDAVRLCVKHDILIVAAAGRDGCRCEQVPDALSAVLAVAGTDSRGRTCPAHEPWAPYAGRRLVVPTEAVPGAAPGDGTACAHGARAAAPLVSALAALLLTLQLRRHAHTDLHAIRGLLLQATDPCDAPMSRDGTGVPARRVNPSRAMSALFAGAAPAPV